jgi:trehalose 6-phosphate synthase
VDRPVVIVSNRGPLSFRHDEGGDLVATRGAGGLVSGLRPVVADTGATWIAAAMSDGDREAAARGLIDTEGFRVDLVAVDREAFRLANDVVSTQVLWFVHHGLYDLPRAPAFGRDLRDAWLAYRHVNEAFADAVAEHAPEGAAVLVQDYHLSLLGVALAERRPDVAAVHFSHTPFATPTWLGVLPSHVSGEVLSSLAAHRACGFHSRRWADDFLACCRATLALTPATFVSPLPADADDLRRAASSPACVAALAEIEEQVGDRAVIARVDRIELSKNLLRGFQAYDDLLEQRPEWRERVVFLASCYPSRSGVHAYLEYQRDVEALVDVINERWATPRWTPIIYDTTDDYPRSVAVLRRADVVLVNPIRDGLNLVAKEAAIVNDRDVVVCLSTEAGVWDELSDAVVQVQPFDVAGTADALAKALRMDDGERRAQAKLLRQLAVARRPADWLSDQLAAAAGPY